MSGKGKKGPVKPKGPTTEELKAENEDLKKRLRLCAATNTLLRRDKAGDPTKVHVEEYGGDQIYKESYDNVTVALKELESQGTGSNPSEPGQDTKKIEDLKKAIEAKDKEHTDLKNTVAKQWQQITGLEQQLKKEHEETQKKLKEEAKQREIRLERSIIDLRTRLTEKEEDIDNIIKKVPQLLGSRTTIPQLSQGDFDQQRNTFNNQIQKLKDELTAAQNKLEANEDELSKLRDDNSTIRAKSAKADKGDKAAKDEIHRLEDAHTELTNTLENRKAQIERMTAERDAASRVIEQANNRISELEKEVATVKEDRDTFKRQVSSLGDQGPTESKEKSELETNNKSLKNKIADLEQKCHEAFSRLDQKDKITENEKKEHKTKIEQKEETINTLRRELSMLKVSGDSDKDTKEKMKKLEDELRKTKETLNNMTKENAKLPKKMESRGGDHERELMAEVESLKSRLSKMAGAQLMDNNPNIADLSDENRATKLGERYSEVYDNEWTDCYEELENSGKNEQECINYLMNMLLTVSKSCAELSVKQMSQLKATALSVPGKENKRPSNTEIRVTQQRQLKELRKAFARDTVSPVVEQCKAESNLNFSGKPAEEKYFKACVELCWFMNVQDPPVILQAPPKTGLKFDGDSYRSYTRTGKTVDFPVWPTMLLHENGPILLKGVVQGK